MREFFPHNAVEYFVSYYDYYQPEAYVPSSDTYIEKDASINTHIEQMRLSATKALLERRDVVIVATVSAIYGLGDPAAYHKMVLHLARGTRINQRDLLAPARGDPVRAQSARPQPRHLPRARRRDRHFPGRLGTRRGARRAIRRRDRADQHVRSAHGRSRANHAARDHLPEDALRDAARDAACGGRSDPRRPRQSNSRYCARRTSSSRRSGSSSARASTWR